MRIFLSMASVAVAAAMFASQASANSINYDVNITIGIGNLTGFIQTDGAIGPLSSANITDWNLLLNDGVSTFDLLGPASGNNSALLFNPDPTPDLTANSASLNFDFSGNHYLLFQNPDIGIGPNYLCLSGSITTCDGIENAISLTVGNPKVALSLSGVQPIGRRVSTTPLPATLPLFATALGALGLLGWRRNRSKQHFNPD